MEIVCRIRSALAALASLAALAILSLASPPAFAAADLVRAAPAKSQVAMTDAIPSLTRAERVRSIGIDRDVLRGAGEALNAKRGAHLLVSFFDDVAVTIEITGSGRTHSGGLALVGRIAGDPASSAVLVDNNGVLSVAVASGDLKYSIQGTPQRGYVAAQIPAKEDFPALVNDSRPVPASAYQDQSLSNASAGPGQISQTFADDGSQIDVMVLYTPAARAARGSNAQIEADIDAQVALTNLVYQNSGVVHRIRLVHKGEFAYVEEDAFVDIGRLRSGTSAAGQIAILRDTYSADLVNVWGVWPQVCGIAYLATPESPVNADYAISLVYAPLCTGPGRLTFAHELGHNMGLLHDYLFTRSSTQVTPEGSSTLTTIGYAHGHVDTVNRFYTVMSYWVVCDAAGVSCNQIPYFANPAVTFNNSAFHAGAVPAPTGEAVHADDHRALNDTRETIANYRVSPDGPEVSVLTLVDRLVKVSEGAGSITLTVARAARSIGAVSVSYATSNGTAIAGTDYTATTGTLNWPDGDTTNRVITVPILPDSLLEGSKTFDVTLSNPTGGAFAGTPNGTGAVATVTVLDDEPDVYPPGGSMPTGFTTPGASTAGWVIDNTNGYRSSTSLASARVLNGTSDLEYTGTFNAGTLTFAVAIGSPETTSKLEFMIDGSVVYTLAGGYANWATISLPISAGTHTLRWRYSNTDTEPCFCEGRAWIDEVTFPQAGPALAASYLAFVPNASSNNVSVIDTLNNTVIATIPVGSRPMGVAALPDGSRVYVTNSGVSSVSVIDTAALKVIATLDLKTTPSTTSPRGIVVSADGQRVYVTSYNRSQVSVIDTATNAVSTILIQGSGSVGIDVNASRTRAYVGETGGGVVEVVDLVANASLGLTTLRNFSYGVALQPNGARAWVAQNKDKSVSLVNASTRQAEGLVSLNGQPMGVAMHPTSALAYVTTGAPVDGVGGNSLAVIDTGTRAVTRYVNVGATPFGVAVHPMGGSIYVANSAGNTVSVIDVTSYSVVATIPVGSEPTALGKFIAAVTKPGAPMNLSASPDSGQIAVNFSPPLFNGGSAIVQYDATCNPGNVTASGSASPIVVTGLTNGTTYSCTVKAWTARGAGPASAPVTAPVAPAAGTVITSANAATVPVLSALNFTVTANGPPVTSYTYTGALPNGVTLSLSGVLSGTPATGTAGSYPIVITAHAAAAPSGTQNFTLTVAKIVQTVNFPQLSARSIASPPFTVSATGGGSGNPVTFFSSTASICTTSGTNGATVTLVTPGNCAINATQAGNADYDAPANLASRNFAVRALQSITVDPPPPLVVGATITLTGTGGGSGRPLWFWTATPATCTVAGQYATGNRLTGVAVGTCTILANQNGDQFYYEDAPEVSLDITVGRAPQVIVPSTHPLPVGTSSQRIVSSGGSGNPVIVTSETPSICTTDSANQITAIDYGLCKLVANQAGNLNYLPAAATAFSMPTFSAMSAIRASHVAAPLPDGRVLVAGGVNASATLATADIYDPATRRWTAVPSMAKERQQSTATVLQDGRVLVVGGGDAVSAGAALASAEIYNPATNTWSAAGTLANARRFHTATRLTDGRVLVTGGQNTGIAAAEIYDPVTNAWSAAASMSEARKSHAATLLSNGKVLVSGGNHVAGSPMNSPVRTVELYNPATNTWAAAGSMFYSRMEHSAVTLTDGKVLVVGGNADVAERYDPVTNTWSGAGTMMYRYGHTTTPLGDGRVMVAGGWGSIASTTAVYNPATNAWSTTSPLLFEHRYHTATLMADGGVLIAGGQKGDGLASGTHGNSEIYHFGLMVTEVALPDARLGQTYGPVTLTSTGGAAPVTYVVTGGQLPNGIALSPAGVLNGMAAALGTFPFTVTATDGYGQIATGDFTLQVTPVPYTVTPSVAGTDGTIAPSVPQPVQPNGTATFTLNPAFAYAASVGGTCGGMLTGNTYVTAAITADCTVIATFTRIWFPPDPPVIGTVTPGSLSGTVNFTPPANDGGTPITKYDVECLQPNSFPIIGTGSAPPVTVTGLAVVATQCRVKATNSVGTSAFSAYSASFTPLQTTRVLTVALGGSAAALSGNRVTSPQGIDCPGDCAEALPRSTAVTLTATTAPGALFSGWSSSLFECNRKLNDIATCSFLISGDVAATAVFVATPQVPGDVHGSIIWPEVNGVQIDVRVGLNGGSPITSFDAVCTPVGGGTPVTGSSPTWVIHVTGMTAGVPYTCTVTQTNAIGVGPVSTWPTFGSVVPLFAVPTLAVTKAGGGRGSVVSSVGGLVCGETCTVSIPAGTSLTLTAQPSEGSTFAGWSGGTGSTAPCTGTGACTITMGTNSTVVATFDGPPLSVVPSAGSHGTISPVMTQTVSYGNTATFTVTPDVGYTASVGGSCGGTLVGTVYTTNPVTASCSVEASFALSAARRFDVTGNGTSDVIWYHAGVFGVIGMNANGLSLDPYYIIDIQSDANWKVVGLGDLNGDGRADLVWYNTVTGELYGLLLASSGATTSEGRIALEPDTNWMPEQVADVNGDGKADIVWKNQTTGSVFIMIMNGLAQNGGQVVYTEPNLNWKIVASGDMNGDGRADLLWRNVATGDIFSMLMDGFTVLSGGVIYTEPNLNWKIIGLADYNADGKSDVLWQNVATGEVFEMQMNGTVISAGGVIYTEPNTQWKIVALGDYNGDGKADILWQNLVTGQVYMILVDGFTTIGANFVYTEPDLQWRIVGP